MKTTRIDGGNRTLREWIGGYARVGSPEDHTYDYNGNYPDIEPGDVVFFRDHPVPILAGHINKNGGLCDCCLYDHDDLIVDYVIRLDLPTFFENLREENSKNGT